MPVRIEITKTDDRHYSVSVSDAAGRSSHRVTVDPAYSQKLLSRKAAPEELIRRSFEFLLEHEPKESILSEFDLAVIQRYFPDYKKEIRRRLGG
ncbi:MAG: hypothetical protein ACRD4D_02200 [Candidatus Acidiferrales bacterium]